jgi:hypothetical protein
VVLPAAQSQPCEPFAHYDPPRIDVINVRSSPPSKMTHAKDDV